MKQAEPNGNTRKKATGSDHVPSHGFANPGVTTQMMRASKPAGCNERYSAHGKSVSAGTPDLDDESGR